MSVLLLPMPSPASELPLCVPDHLASSVHPDSVAAGRGPAHDWAENSLATVDGKTGYLSFLGTTSFVYGSYAGCGERMQIRSEDGLKLSYSTVKGIDPFDRLKDVTRDRESFFDAEFQSAVQGLGRIGYAASMHAATANGEALGDRVTGTRLWFSSADQRFRMSSEVAVSASETAGRVGSARRHQMSLVVFDTGGRRLSTSLSFSHVDRDFKGRRSTATPDRQVLGSSARLTAGDAALSLNFSSAQDNLDRDPDLAMHRWLTMSAEGSYRLGGGPVLPDSLRIYASRSESRETHRDLDGDLVGENDVAGIGAVWPGWRFGDRAATLGGDAFADWTTGSDPLLRGFAVGANGRLSVDLERLLAMPGQLATGGQIIGGDGAPFGLDWRWNVAAEVDCLDLLFDSGSDGTAYMLGRFGSSVWEDDTGLTVDYLGMFTAGLRF